MSIAAKPRQNKNTQSQDDFGSIQVDNKSEDEDSDDEDAGEHRPKGGWDGESLCSSVIDCAEEDERR